MEETKKVKEKTIAKSSETKAEKLVAIIVMVLLFMSSAFILGTATGGYLMVKEEYKELESKEENKKPDNQEDECDTNLEPELYGLDLISHKIEQLDYILDIGQITDTSKIEDEVLFDFAMINMPNVGEEFNDDGSQIIKLETINQFLMKTLNTTLKNPKEFSATFNTCSYDEKAKEFTCAGHGGMSYSTLNRIVSAKYENEYYVIQVKKAITEINDIGYETNPYFKTVEDLKQNKNPLFKSKIVETSDSITYDVEPLVYFNNIPNEKLHTYTYKFKLVKNAIDDYDYVLESLTY